MNTPIDTKKAWRRPGATLAHTFRSKVTAMTSVKDRYIVVVLENGKVYRSNKKMTRWYRISP